MMQKLFDLFPTCTPGALVTGFVLALALAGATPKWGERKRIPYLERSLLKEARD